jgi:hypothetical protein
MTADAMLAVVLALGAAQTRQSGACMGRPVQPGGQPVESRFFGASLERAREALEDAMQANGVLLYESAATVVRGQRVGPRVNALGLPRGDEALVGHLEAAERDGLAGTLVRVETRRPGGKEGNPNRNWSAAVLDEIGCLVTTLAGGERTVAGGGGVAADAAGGQPRDVPVPAGTSVTLLLRRFFFWSDLRVGQKLPFEVASDVSVGPDVVIRRGALGVARVKAAGDAEEPRSLTARIEFEFVSAVSDTRIPVRGAASFAGEKGKFPTLSWGVWHAFALCAGTPFDVVVDGDQRVRVGREARHPTLLLRPVR